MRQNGDWRSTLSKVSSFVSAALLYVLPSWFTCLKIIFLLSVLIIRLTLIWGPCFWWVNKPPYVRTITVTLVGCHGKIYHSLSGPEEWYVPIVDLNRSLFYSLPIALHSKSTDILYLNLAFGYFFSNSVVPCYTFRHSYATLLSLLLLL